MKVKEIENSCYIVQNEENNKVLKLGQDEFDFLMALREHKNNVISESPLTEEQKSYLSKKFKELGFCGNETKKAKDKQNLSNIKLITFKCNKKLDNIFKILSDFVSPIGFILFLGALLGIVVSFVCYTDIISYGITHVSINLKTVILIYIMVLATSIVHELFHAVACYKYSGSTGEMGIKLFYFMPVFYTDVSTIYLTNNRKKMFVTSAVGLMFNIFLSGASICAYIFLYQRGIKSNILFSYFIFQFATILRNILPFEKFDGYRMIASVSGIHNLYDKSILLFIMMLRNLKGYVQLSLNWFSKIILTLFGGINLLFRWLFWFYCIRALSQYIQRYISYQISYVLVRILYVVIILNCIRFVKSYICKYKKEGNILIKSI